MNMVVHHGSKKPNYGLESRGLIRGRNDMPKSRSVLRLSVTYESFSKRRREHSMFLAASKRETENSLFKIEGALRAACSLSEQDV